MPPWALHELLGLHEHATGAAAGIVDAPLVRREHLHQHPHHGPGRVELPALLALGVGELPEEILVDLAQHVLCLVLRPEANGGDEVDQFAELARLELGPGKPLVQDALERWVVLFDGHQRIIDPLADVRLLGLIPDAAPIGRWREPRRCVPWHRNHGLRTAGHGRRRSGR